MNIEEEDKFRVRLRVIICFDAGLVITWINISGYQGMEVFIPVYHTR